MFGDSNDSVVHTGDQNDPNNPYHASTSYSPNPITVTDAQMDNALTSASLKCGPDYKLLHNNCQISARLFMTALGAKHDRELFHP